MHLAESKVQAVVGQKRYGTTLTGHLHKLGLLAPNFTAAHAICALVERDLFGITHG